MKLIMMNSFLDYLKESPDCLYIYNRDFSIYGLESKERYTIVVKDDWICPEDWVGFDTDVYEIFYLNEWFNIVLNGDLIGWECACLNKKYVIKEHVKLLMKTNPLQLKKTIRTQRLSNETYSDINVLRDWELVKNIKFAIQIIENHKIVNFKEAKNDYFNLLKCESIEEISEYINKSYQILKDLTDGMLLQERVKKINNESNI